jgi:lactoylglutathione lyase
MDRIRAVTLATLPMVVFSALTISLAAAQTKGPEFDHQAFHVRDLEKSAEFYTTILGLEKLPDPFKDGKHVWLRVGEHGQLHLIGGAAELSQHAMDVHLSFRVPSLQEFITRLEQKQVKYVNSRGEAGKVTDRPDGVKQIYFQDPDGYWIEVNDNKF